VSDAPIFRFNDAREAIVREVVHRVSERVSDPLPVLGDAIYHEVKRLSASGGHEEELARWRSLSRRLSGLSDAAKRVELENLATVHAWDVAGNFDPRVYGMAARLMPPLLGALIAPRKTFSSLRRVIDASALADRIAISGHHEHVRKLTEIGTVVYVPTHLSNMDSIVFGYALQRAGLPPATYGAGKNLFTNPVLSFFMHNLGAYRVDRRLRHGLYKEVLKTYSCVLLEGGYHSLFFPGGTRSRSGGVERKLKLGLAGTGVEAFARTAQKGREKRVFFVPATISYLITLEAETLINDYLQEAGKSRFIIEDDESSRVGRVVAFMEKILRHDAGVAIRFGEPLDPFGNRVDENGMSVDGAGHVVDPLTYVTNRKGDVVVDAARDAQYTRELGDAVCASYLRHQVMMGTHLVAAVLMNQLRKAAGTDDLFALLQVRQRVSTPIAEVVADVRAMRDTLLDLEAKNGVVLADNLRHATGEAIVEEAVRAWRGAHQTQVIDEQDGTLAIGDAPLIFYYQNRLAAHGVALDVLGESRGGAK
jgi:glycerol-3-phosphate O-acyltransferase